MATENQNATIKAGGSYKLEFQIDGEDGNPLDLTGLEIYYRAANKAHTSTPLLTVPNAAITRKEDATPGTPDVAVVPMKSADTEGLPDGDHYHEIYQVDAQGERFPLATGTLTVQHAQVAFHS